MKKLLFICVLCCLISCKKDKDNSCYNCLILRNGVMKTEKMCGQIDGHYKDDEGNDLECMQIH